MIYFHIRNFIAGLHAQLHFILFNSNNHVYISKIISRCNTTIGRLGYLAMKLVYGIETQRLIAIFCTNMSNYSGSVFHNIIKKIIIKLASSEMYAQISDFGGFFLEIFCKISTSEIKRKKSITKCQRFFFYNGDNVISFLTP